MCYRISRISDGRRIFFCLFYLYGAFFLSLLPAAHGTPQENSEKIGRSPSSQGVADSRFICNEFFSPFHDPDRKSLGLLRRRLSGRYGDYRRSYKPGHLHAGIDLKGAFEETVYPIGRGYVHLIFRDFPHQSVVVKHIFPDGGYLYSMYVHIEEIKVEVGEWVTEKTPLARLFTQNELNLADFGTANHLHFEIRKSIDDHGWASASSTNRDELDRFCLDPWEFFKKHL